MNASRFQKLACAHGNTLLDPLNGQPMHSMIGPEIEAELIFLEPSRIRERLAEDTSTPLVLWDVGMGIAANSVLAWQLARSPEARRPLEIHSFEKHPEALALALDDLESFPFLTESAPQLRELLASGRMTAGQTGSSATTQSHEARSPSRWFLHSGDFAEILSNSSEPFSAPHALASPDLIYWDFYSPKVCPELWSLELFTTLRLLAPRSRFYTYSAATPVRVGLLLAGFHVGRPRHGGRATPLKSESTMAVADPHDAAEITELLDETWLEKLSRSTQFRPYGSSHFAREASYEDVAQAVSSLRQFR